MHASVFLLRALYAYLRDEGLATEDFSRGREDNASDGPAPTAGEAALSEAIQRAFQAGAPPGLALQVGAATPLHAFGILGSLIAHTPDLRSAVAMAQRFMPLLQDSGQIRLSDGGHVATLTYQPPSAGFRTRRFATEFALAFMVTVARRFLGRSARPRRVLLPYSAPQYVAEYERMFCCPVVFEAETASLVFDSYMLDKVQLFADRELRDLLEKQLAWRLTSEDKNTPLHVRVRAILERDGDVLSERDLRSLSRRVGLSRRVLMRKLAAEGQTLSGLLEEFRKQQAMYLLTETDIPLKNMADKLGFSEQSAFYRAFKRWTGNTPLQFRRTHQQRSSGAAA